MTKPTEALEALLMIPPIDLYIEQEAIPTSQRLMTAICWKDSRYGHAAIRIIETIPQLQMAFG